MTATDSTEKRPNILMIMVDQMRFPRFDKEGAPGFENGFEQDLRKILGFQEHESLNNYRKFFPGLCALKENAVVLNNHKAASAACVPSRTALFTGQYGTRTGALQTDGVFKNGADSDFPWLKRHSFPTLGHWMRENGYTTHYFGKWHISGEDTTDLEDYGFSNWELSGPDPHGTLPNNLGYYRDYQFEDVATSFLRRQGLGIPYSSAHAKYNVAEANGTFPEDMPPEPSDQPTPWFAVSSFTNPHDIGAYPGVPSRVCNERVKDAPYSLAVPPRQDSEFARSGTMPIKLNPQGFPQDNASIPLTWDEELLTNNKPDCQFDYAYKMGLALASKAGGLVAKKAHAAKDVKLEEQMELAVDATLSANKIGLPFAMTDNPQVASESFLQYYAYLMHEVDQHINAVLTTLEETGQADNTIVIFCADHGEYGAAHHMMMEKWHSAYEEVVHVPMVVRFPDSMHKVPGGLAQFKDVATSHIDILPTVLGLTGVSGQQILDIQTALEKKKMTEESEEFFFSDVRSPVGQDFSGLIMGETSAWDRQGVLFINHDTITEPLPKKASTKQAPEKEPELVDQYDVFLTAVDKLRADAVQTDRQKNQRDYPDEAENLAAGPVRQPNHVHCVMSNDNWKLVRYFDPTGVEDDQYELYDLMSDPYEASNLIIYNAKFPTVANQETLTPKSVEKIKIQAIDLMKLLKTMESEMLSKELRR